MTSESLRGHDPSYTGGYNPNAISNAASQPSQSDKEKPSGPLSSLLSNLAKTKVPDHAGSRSTVTGMPTSVSDPLAQQAQKTNASPDPNPTAATAHQQSGKLTGIL